MIQLNLRDPRPIYEQIKDSFIKLILCGAMTPNDKMPSVRSLAASLSINPNTIQRAYNDLEAEGYIYSVSGKGSFVNELNGKETSHIIELKEKLSKTVAELKTLGISYDEISKVTKEGYDND